MEKGNEIEKIEVELLLEAIYRYYGFDFRNYAYGSIRRRILHRLQIENVDTISALQGKLLYRPEMMESILKDFSINVTEMFRDPDFFKSFRTNVVPNLKDLSTIRIWHAGCASGEEAYSMAILLYEEGLYEKSRIYATDMNEEILEKAKLGEIPLGQMKLYTRNYQEAGGKGEFSEYYAANTDHAFIVPQLKKNIIFGHHNLVTDYSFNEFQVIICRNVMIYFNNELKERVFNLFYNSLCEQGYLGLGNKESLSYCSFSSEFEEVDFAQKIYKKIE
ncbi:CheR family methyltransferase [Bacillus sp. FJAT-45350]|uniref:CheR family methyltransferase n=1 Tax=Bacillus sp. FJAT-45350 TaxID=2011014 RepID=UPI00211C0533|nr:protein-glutamate O-methyltransferase CheR [Bacillus sp. FJAT-45350]